MLTWIDGHFVSGAKACLPADEGALLFGDSLFETLLVCDGVGRFAAPHLDRLEGSARLLGWPVVRARLEEGLEAMAARLPSGTFRLRLTLTRGRYDGLMPCPGETGAVLLQARPWSEPTSAEREAGAVCVLAPNRRANPLSHLPQMKRGNYADCLCAAAYARECGAREALFVDAAGNLLEGATTNLFAVQGGTLVTPPLTGNMVLGGIMRQQLLRLATNLGWPTAEADIALEGLPDYDEAFLSNSLIGLLPIAAVSGRPVRRGEQWRTLLARIP